MTNRRNLFRMLLALIGTRKLVTTTLVAAPSSSPTTAFAYRSGGHDFYVIAYPERTEFYNRPQLVHDYLRARSNEVIRLAALEDWLR